MKETTIFAAALGKKSPQEREAFLEEACGGDAALRANVESLLAAHEQAGGFLDPAGDASERTTVHSEIPEGPGAEIGRYKLLQQIGEGGMGVVYLAEQTEPVRRKVALKIIRPGMDSQQVIARFEAERQALAMMEHQNISRVLDAGTTDSARPYFVMELVKGVPITEYCDRNKLSPRERLELFIPVCQAIQHAHQKGVIHRDIKPSNVLVCLYDGQPVSKVIDFGVAKAIDQRLTERTMFTQHGQIVGTLEYMSPEQAEMNQLDVDTRSDIYSLGVLLYQLLTGSTPISKEKLREAAFVEILRSICEDEPERPSTRLSHSGDALPAISEKRRTDAKKLGTLLRGELDWIVMKSLDKDRTRRYATAGEFAKDIQRHLENEPVEACPPSAMYKFRKFARRHRAAFSTAAAFAVLLFGAAAFSTWQAVRATHAERLALDEQGKAIAARTVAIEERNKAEAAEQAEAAARATAEAAAKAEAAARQQAEQDRTRAVAAEQQARREAARNLALREHAQDALALTMFEQARAVRLAGQPGRRWRSLELIRQAEQLRSRERPNVQLSDDVKNELPDPVALPNAAALRTEAVASLLLPDGRLASRSDSEVGAGQPAPMQWDGNVNAVSPDGRFVAAASFDPETLQSGIHVFEVATGKKVWSADQPKVATDFPLIMAVGPRGEQLAWFSLAKRDRLMLRNLSSDEPPRELLIPGQPDIDVLRERGKELLQGSKSSDSDSSAPKSQDDTQPADESGEKPDAASNANRQRKPGQSLDDLPEPNLTPAEKKQVLLDAAKKAFESGAEGYQQSKTGGGNSDNTANRVKRPGSVIFDLMLVAPVFSSDGDWLATLRSAGAGKRAILLWDLRGGADSAAREIGVVDFRPFQPPAFSPDSQTLAWIDKQGTIVLWNLAENKAAGQLELPVYLDGVLDFTPDGRRIVTHGRHPDEARGREPERSARLLVWDIAENRLVAAHETSRTSYATSLSTSPDGRRAALGQMTGEMLVVDLQSGDKIRLDHGSMPVALNWTPDGRVVSTGMGAVRAWELATETPLSTRVLHAKNANQPLMKFAISPDGQTVAVETRSPAIDLYDLRSGQGTGRFESNRLVNMPGSQLAFSLDGKQIAQVAFDAVRLWDVGGDGQPRRLDKNSAFRPELVTSIGFRPDGTLLLAGLDKFIPTVKEAPSGNVVWKHGERQLRAWPRMSRNGSLIAFHTTKQPGSPRMIEVRRLPGGEVLHNIASKQPGLKFQTIVDVSPDSRWLIEIEKAVNVMASWAGRNPLSSSPLTNISAGANESWTATLWRIESGEEHWQIGGDVKPEAMTFSPDGRWLAVTQRDGRVVLWDVDQKQRMFDWQAWTGTPQTFASTRDLVFTADSRYLAVAAESGQAIRLLDLKQLNEQLAAAGLDWTKVEKR